MTEINFIAGHGRGDRSPEHEIEAAAPAPLTSSPMSPPTAVDVDPIAQRLAVLQKRLDIEMKVGELLSSLCSFQLMVERPGSVQSVYKCLHNMVPGYLSTLCQPVCVQRSWPPSPTLGWP